MGNVKIESESVSLSQTQKQSFIAVLFIVVIIYIYMNCDGVHLMWSISFVSSITAAVAAAATSVAVL